MATRVCSVSSSSSASRTSGHASWPHLLDGLRVEASNFGQHRLRQRPAHGNGARPALLQRRVIQIGKRIGVQDLVRELRRHGRIHSETTNASVGNRLPARGADRRCPSLPSARLSSLRAPEGDPEWEYRLECSPGKPRRRGKPRPASRRTSCAGCAAVSFSPCRNRGSARERVASQRQRVPNSGEASAACSSTGWTEDGCRK